MTFLKDPSLQKRLFIASYMQVAQQFTGKMAFQGYAVTIFGLIGITDPFVFNAIWCGIMVVGVIFGLLFLGMVHALHSYMHVCTHV